MRYVLNLGLIVFLLALQAQAQTSDELRLKLGKPIEETFRVNDHTFVSVEYSEDGEFQKIEIKSHEGCSEPQLDTGMICRIPNSLSSCSSSSGNKQLD